MPTLTPRPAETANVTARAEKLLRRLRRDTLGYLAQADVLDDLLSALGTLDTAARKTPARAAFDTARNAAVAAVESYCDDVEHDIAEAA